MTQHKLKHVAPSDKKTVLSNKVVVLTHILIVLINITDKERDVTCQNVRRVGDI